MLGVGRIGCCSLTRRSKSCAACPRKLRARLLARVPNTGLLLGRSRPRIGSPKPLAIPMVDATWELPSISSLSPPTSSSLTLTLCNTLLCTWYCVCGNSKDGNAFLVALLLLYTDIPANSGVCSLVTTVSIRFPRRKDGQPGSPAYHVRHKHLGMHDYNSSKRRGIKRGRHAIEFPVSTRRNIRATQPPTCNCKSSDRGELGSKLAKPQVRSARILGILGIYSSAVIGDA